MVRLLALVLALAACGGSGGAADDGDGGGGGTPDPATVFDPAVTDVIVEIDYETGQEPYTGPILGFGDTFDVTITNVDRLFANRKALAIPRTLDAMEDIGAVADEELTVDDLLALAAAHRAGRDAADAKTYYVLFVSGHFRDGAGVQSGVLGVSLGGTGVIAMFKDVIRTTDVPAFPHLVRHVEQSTLVHELAHAIGLVDNGVPLATPHKDAAHGAHCDDDRCVMFWQNEGVTGATEFASTYVTSGDVVLFDAACLADADALTGGL